MHRKFWFLVAAAVAVFALTGTAAATGSRHGMTAFQKSYANIKWSPQARQQAGQLNYGMEQSIDGFFGLHTDQALFWASLTGEVPVIRGNYIVGDDLVYHLDLASSVVSTATTLTINIKPGADWAVEGGITHPVVAADYALTYNVIMDPRNPVGSTTGYSNIKPGGAGVSYTMPGGAQGKTIIFKWAHPFADWKDTFGFILPDFALPTAANIGANGGQAFNEIWRDCVCIQTLDGNGDVVNGDPISAGPFFMHSYSPAVGVIDTPNNRWYGPNAGLSQVNFLRTTPGATENAGFTGGTLDAGFPAASAAYVGLKTNPNFVYATAKGFVQEHMDFNQANPLIARPWMRQSIALGINRPAVIKANYFDTGIANVGSMGQLNSPEYVLGKYSKAPYDYFKTWNYNPQRAINILAQHCTGGPTNPNNNNTKYWVCPDGPATFEWWSTTAPIRVASGAIFQAQLKAIGIQLNVHNTGGGNLFGNILPNAQNGTCISGGVPQVCGSQTYDIAEYAWVGGADPSGFNAIYECFDSVGKGGQNYKNFCYPAINNQQAAGDIDLSATRYQHYLKVSLILSNKAAVFPLYARPNLSIWNVSVGGMSHSLNPTSTGPTWNIEDWTH